MNSGTNASARISTDAATMKMRKKRHGRRRRLFAREPTGNSAVAMPVTYHRGGSVSAGEPRLGRALGLGERCGFGLFGELGAAPGGCVDGERDQLIQHIVVVEHLQSGFGGSLRTGDAPRH